jgi:hypothetical protein
MRGGGPTRGPPGRGFYGYPAMPPIYVGYYFPEEHEGRGRGRMQGPPMYFPGTVPPPMIGNPMHPSPAQSSGLQVRMLKFIVSDAGK